MEKPNEFELLDAAGVCYDLADYIKETESQAHHDISILEEAAGILDTFSDEINQEEDENGEGPNTEN